MLLLKNECSVHIVTRGPSQNPLKGMTTLRKNLLRLGVMMAATVALSFSAGTAFATPGGPGVSGTILYETTVGEKHIVYRRIIIPPGQGTGWHFHDGPLVGFVKKGTLSHFDSDCESDGVYRPGSTITEPSGADYVHIGRNLGKTDVVLYVWYVLPLGAPLSQDADNPGCEFQ
jgi:quercetin dioxygenase-like cupin family protein